MNKHMGPQMAGKAHPQAAALADIALIDASACAAPGSMSVSWWHEKVACGEAPQPAIRRPRCTRWRVADVRAFWIAFAENGTKGADKLLAVTAKASNAAKAKRAQQSEVA